MTHLRLSPLILTAYSQGQQPAAKMATLDDTEPADFSLTHFDSDIQFLDPDEHEAGSLSCWPPLSLEPVSHDLGTTQVSKPSTQNGHARLNIVRRLCGRPPVRFAKAAVRVLEEWLVNHRDAPYATTEDLECLKYMTGLRRSQISNWLANARKRGKIQSLQPSASLDTSSARSSRMPLLSPLAHLHPFERWLYLDTEYGLCSISEIEQAMKKGQVEPMPHGKLPKEVACADNLGYTASNSQYSYNRAPPSITSMEIRSYAANAKSVSSDQWRHPFGETPSTMTRSSRRRRRPRSQICGSQNPAESESAKSSRQFQCTFCNDSFKKKHDWQRHEKSQHIPLETWVCCPQGSVNVDPDTNEISCVFCGAPDPDPEHIQDHKYTQCISRSPSERTFHRKDHLRQHLRLMHGDCRMILAMDAWMSEVPVLRSRCGFCEMFFDTWKARVEHLADHFRNGALMKHWEGDWGFDANILGILEKAMLPSNRSKGNLEINSSGSNEYGNLDFTAAPTRFVSTSPFTLNRN